MTATRTYTRGSTPVAERSTQTGTTVLTWLLADQQNTVTAQLVDSSGALTIRRQDPYGQSRTNGSTTAWADGHGFLNAVTSTATGLTQLGARLYDATLGRFLSVDAVLAPFNPVQNNGYSYAGNNPITASDPSGNCMLSSDGNACVTGIGGSGAKAGAKSGSSRPPAAGNGALAEISPHVYDSADDPRLKLLRAEYQSTVGHNSVNETTELDLWYLICENGGNCGSPFLNYLRQEQGPGGFGVSMIAGGLGSRFVFINEAGQPGGGADSVVVRQLNNPKSMVGVSVDDLRMMAKRAGWTNVDPDKYGNERWVNGDQKGSSLKIKLGGVPDVPDPSGTHLGDYFELNSGGLGYHASMAGTRGATGSMKGYFFTSEGPGHPDLARPFPDLGGVEGEVGGFGDFIAP